MHPKPKQTLFLLIQTTILSIYFPTFFGHSGSIITRALNKSTPAVICSGEPFDCGNVRYISYPFWGGSRSRDCGRGGFELVCHDGDPMLNISSLSYRVLEINLDANTLKVAREDLNNACPKVPKNTTIDLHLFKYAARSNDKNLTLYFDCTGDRYQLERLPNKFTCDGKGAETINLFKAGDASSGPGPNITCTNNIFVPINKETAQYLENPTESSINLLRPALTNGFSVQWYNDPKQYYAPFCNSRYYSACIPGGKIYNRTCDYESCHPHTAAPEEPRGMPPEIQRPGYPPEILGYHPQTEGSNAGKHRTKVIVIAVALSTTGVIIASITISCFRKTQHSANGPKPVCNQDVEKFLLQHGSLAPKRYKYSEIKKITKSFSDKLGQGGYGSVYKGMLSDGCLVAVKVLTETNSSGEEFINEVASISRTSHINIVSLLGFCYDGNKRALVYEFMPNKSLDKFLTNNGSTANADCCLNLEKLYKIAIGIAKGLEYLHTGCSTRIIHFDIKPQNILLDEDFCPKISDFGLAKLCKKKQSILSVLGTRGTIGYIAPEIFSRNFGGASHKSDVYSYGMMLFEMAGARKIVETEMNQSSENYFPDKIYEQVIIDVTKKLDDFMIEEEEEARKKMLLIGFWCIQTTPSDRPLMSKVVEMLEGSLQSIQIPPKPFLFSPNLPGQKISSSFSAYVETENSVQD